LTNSPAKPLRAFYGASIADFVHADPSFVLGCLSDNSGFSIETTQRDAWRSQIGILKTELKPFSDRGSVYFEFVVPRLGKRIDVLALIDRVIFVIEFKVGESLFNRSAIDQVWDYALDLKNFHETSHHCVIAPLLVATNAKNVALKESLKCHNDGVFEPINSSPELLTEVINKVLKQNAGGKIDAAAWECGSYRPTPTIIEAASTLYSNHTVAEISQKDSDKEDFTKTTTSINNLIARARATRVKAICFVTGVPGAGKTLVGLDIATNHMDAKNDLHSVYLSGNGPLVSILREALARNDIARKKITKQKIRKGEARKAVEAFIQNVHHFRDAYLTDEKPPVDHVVIFDEAQRAWTLEQTTQFMARKKGQPNFNRSEPDFLISCLDRHPDWSVVVCLVGGGQEINTGEAGISEWLRAIRANYPKWEVHISPNLLDAGEALKILQGRENVHFNEDLHLAVSMRSFRAEHVSTFVKHLLDRQYESARAVFQQVQSRYPIVITRDLDKAKRWLREKARGTERFGMVVSSQAQRLKPHAIDVKSPMDPIHWFLDDKDDVRSSYYLEDVATEFHVQGLELDWACVVWDADLRYGVDDWEYRSFVGSKWQKIHLAHRQMYLKNAYRVLLTRARQGMVIVIPPGDHNDPTRDPAFYDPVYLYLVKLGIETI
jgi:DUF2075 family protein